MTRHLSDSIPNLDDALALEPEILAGYLLAHLNQKSTSNRGEKFHRYNVTNDEWLQGAYPRNLNKLEELKRAIMEAWEWLVSQGLLALHHDGDHKWYFVTRRGRKIKSKEDLQNYLRSTYLAKDILHPILAEKVWSLFVSADFDTAVFQAFKQIEVMVREKGKFSKEDIGVSLMRKAFNPDTGPLTDESLDKGERQAISDLFSGAIGYQKNAHSHRNVGLSSPAVAAELILFANHLLRIIEDPNSNG